MQKYANENPCNPRRTSKFPKKSKLTNCGSWVNKPFSKEAVSSRVVLPNDRIDAMATENRKMVQWES